MNRYCKVSETFSIPKEVTKVDQWLNQNFNYNEFGRLRNDISALVAATTVQEYEKVASRLLQIQANDPYPNLNDEQKLKVVPSRYMQDPAELDKFVTYLGQVHPDLLGIVEESTSVDDSDSFGGENDSDSSVNE